VADPQRGVVPGWRDPYVYPDPAGDGWHMLICATARPERRGVRTAGRGVIGHARSGDLLDWEIQPPLSVPAGFGELEVPQVHVVDGQPLLIFSSGDAHQPPERLVAGVTARLFSVAGDAVTGHWDVTAAEPFAHPTLYAAQLVRRPDGQWCLFGFRDTEDGVFRGEILDPIPVERVGARLVPADVPAGRR
jgi:beta-fructofuranosidase